MLFQVKMDIKALIFDCDGTLANTMPLHGQAWRETLACHGKPYSRDFLNRLKGLPETEIITLYNQAYGCHLDPVALTDEKNCLVKKKLKTTRPIKPVADIVRRFKGRLPMAVASGGTRTNVFMTLEAIGLKDFFKTIITCDDDVLPKPSPDIFLEAARRLKVSPSVCQVFEDGAAGLFAARAAGMLATDVTFLL